MLEVSESSHQRIAGAGRESDGRAIFCEAASLALDVHVVVVRSTLAAGPACHGIVQ